MSNTVLNVLAGVWVIGGGGLWWWRYSIGKQLALMQSTPTSTAAAVKSMAPGTVVEIKGALRCEAPLTSEFAKQSCAYYSAVIEHVYEELTRDSDGRSKRERRSRTIQSNIRHAPSSVDDGTGQVGMSFENAEVEAVEVMRQFETNPGNAIESLGRLFNLTGGTIGYTYIEHVLAPGQQVYVLGSVQADGTVGPQKGKPFIISYKSEEERAKSLASTRLWILIGVIACLALAIGFLAWSLRSA